MVSCRWWWWGLREHPSSLIRVKVCSSLSWNLHSLWRLKVSSVLCFLKWYFSFKILQKSVQAMGGGDDQSSSYYGGPSPQCGPPSSAGSSGGLSREYQYVTGPDHPFRSGSSSSRQNRNTSSTGSSNYHSPHVVSSTGKQDSRYWSPKVLQELLIIAWETWGTQ